MEWLPMQILSLQVAELRREWRNEQGALTVQFPDSMMLVSNPRSANPTISVKRDDAYETPANLFVSELMIMANEAVGKLGMFYLQASPAHCHSLLDCVSHITAKML